MKSNLEKLIEALDADTNAFYGSSSYYGEFLSVTEAQHDQYYDEICQRISNGNTKAEYGGRDKRKEHVKKMLLDTDKPLLDLLNAKIKSKNDLKLEIRNLQLKFIGQHFDGSIKDVIDELQSLGMEQKRILLRQYMEDNQRGDGDRF